MDRIGCVPASGVGDGRRKRKMWKGFWIWKMGGFLAGEIFVYTTGAALFFFFFGLMISLGLLLMGITFSFFI